MWLVDIVQYASWGGPGRSSSNEETSGKSVGRGGPADDSITKLIMHFSRFGQERLQKMDEIDNLEQQLKEVEHLNLTSNTSTSQSSQNRWSILGRPKTWPQLPEKQLWLLKS